MKVVPTTSYTNHFLITKLYRFYQFAQQTHIWISEHQRDKWMWNTIKLDHIRTTSITNIPWQSKTFCKTTWNLVWSKTITTITEKQNCNLSMDIWTTKTTTKNVRERSEVETPVSVFHYHEWVHEISRINDPAELLLLWTLVHSSFSTRRHTHIPLYRQYQ